MKVTQSCPILLTPWTVVHGILQARILEWVAFPFSLPKPGIKPRSPALQADSLPVASPGKPKNTGVNTLSLLQRIFPTQESNAGVSCIAGGFFTNWAIWETPSCLLPGKRKTEKRLSLAVSYQGKERETQVGKLSSDR